MQQKIIVYGDDRLRKCSDSVTIKDPFIDLIRNLFDTLNCYGGIGLAAPQIGLNQSVFVIDTFPQSKFDPDHKPFKLACLNPQILWYSKRKTLFNEGCLSIPSIYEDVSRPESITVRYLNERFEQVEETIDGIKARIFQHEFDHLNGVLFIDHLKAFQKVRIAYQLNKIKNNSFHHSEL
ncbi:MAG: peptide deformylase [Microbacter sp.]